MGGGGGHGLWSTGPFQEYRLASGPWSFPGGGTPVRPVARGVSLLAQGLPQKGQGVPSPLDGPGRYRPPKVNKLCRGRYASFLLSELNSFRAAE